MRFHVRVSCAPDFKIPVPATGFTALLHCKAQAAHFAGQRVATDLREVGASPV
jgi:hypothetical protein